MSGAPKAGCRGRQQGSLEFPRPRWVGGVDEAGRGPLAGPVTAAAVMLDPRDPIDGLSDSKALTPERREELAVEIRRRSLAWGIGWADVAEIDALDILQATFLAMRRALLAMPCAPEHVIIDGDRCPILAGLALRCTMEPVVGGDATVACVSAASILAKVARDAYMVELECRYPGYGLAIHKGYSTPVHLEALRRLGPSAIHRTTYAPVQSALSPDLATAIPA
jgi:ribonuclease HII